MPFTRISLQRGKSASYLQALSDGVHRALVEAFDVPPTDRFQVIHQCEANELVFDRHYGGGPRSDDFVLICVTAGRPRPESVKRAFFRRLADLLAAAPGIRPQDVMVIIHQTQMVDWSFGNGLSAVPEAGEAR
ncbi:MAG TPA: tautomerase family protein [Noviherbaspirillum sp.]|nr:tautomerase family protein [Noviherbaspirillum sp.]